jgi:hypothetical protein
MARAASAAPSEIAPHRITVKMIGGITSSTQLPSEELIAARRSLAKGGKVSTSKLRALADLGDGFAALKFAQWLAERTPQSPAADIAHYYGIAAATGRGGGIQGLIRTLDRVDPAELSAGRTKTLRSIVITYAQAGNSAAIDALLRYHLSKRPFGSLQDEIDIALAHAQGEGARSMALRLATGILYDGQHTTADLEKARDYLNLALKSERVETLILAQNLLPLVERSLTTARPTQTEISR